MILKASQRAGGSALAAHLLRTDENDHVEVHQVRGFVRNNLHDAFKEAYAISRGTKCKQFLFSLSLSPPVEERVSIESFEKAIDRIEMRLGLTGLPRAVVFHEKSGRRHAHCVWSRIDARTMRARQMDHFKLKLNGLSRELYLEHGWKMPQGLARTQPENPFNFSLAQWQQAKRVGRDPQRIKQQFREAWAISDSGAAFQHALEERGYYLARGDRRGFVAVDWRGEIYSVSRWCKVPSAQVAERLGKLGTLPGVEEVQQRIARRVAEKEKIFEGELTLQFETARRALREKRDALVGDQRRARVRLEDRLAARWQAEEIERASRLRRGLLGIWDWFTGRRTRTITVNEQEVERARRRDNEERQSLIDAQLKERRQLQTQIQSIRKRTELHEEGSRPLRRGRRNKSVQSMQVPLRQGRHRSPDA